MARIHIGQQLYNFPPSLEGYVPVLSFSSRNNRHAWSNCSNNNIPELNQINQEAPNRFIIPGFASFDQTLQTNETAWSENIGLDAKNNQLAEARKFGDSGLIQKEYYCKWKDCSSSFVDPYSLQMHVMKHVNNNFINAQSVCFVCGKCLNSHNELQEHISNEHTEDLPYLFNPGYNIDPKENIECIIPNLVNNVKSPIFNFIQYENSQQLPQYNNNTDFEKSLKEYEEFLGNFMVTPESFINEDSKRKYKCNFPNCGKSFKRSGHLKRHKIVHLPQKERRRYYCEYEGCKKNYSTKYDLAAHVRQVHEGVILYKCDTKGCCRRFVKKESLENHKMMFHQYRGNNRTKDLNGQSKDEYMEMIAHI